MEVARLILNYIEVLVWPAVLLFALVSFRKPIVSLLGTVGELSVGGDKGFKLKMQAIQKAASATHPESENSQSGLDLSEIIFSLPDNDFIFLDSLAEHPRRKTYVPTTGQEYRHLQSLADYGVFNRKSLSEFELTEIGKQILENVK